MTQRPLLALAAALALSGCFSFGGKPPPTLMRLTADRELAAGTTRTSNTAQAITVVVPVVPQELQTPRVPVRTGATAVSYVKNAQWIDTPDALFARLLGETISARTGRVVLDPKQFTFDPGTRLTGTLHSFGFNADTSEAVVIYDAVLGRGAEAVEARRFEARVPVAVIDATTAPVALNNAANSVAAEVAAWIG
jgi:cholesterol transport system auxiliary component